MSNGNGPRFYNEPPPEIIHLYEQRGDNCWYPKEFDRKFTSEEHAGIREYERNPGTPAGQVKDSDLINLRPGAVKWVEIDEKKMNPKYVRAQKDGKAPMEFLVYSVLESEAKVLAHGGGKYGARNWRLDEILASTYEGAMMRHLLAWCQGEDIDPDSGEPHLSHLRACAAVVMDADDHDKLIDDRNRMESKNDE